jgi:HD-GYP domain-containing protein (c-di-GMP phosphodiesterase class II)
MVDMAFSPNVEEQELLAETLERTARPLPRRERVSEITLALAFVVAAAGIWALHPPGGLHPLTALVALGVMAIAARVIFFAGLGVTAATQLAFVPLVFAVPVALVAPAVVAALLLSALPDVLTGRKGPRQLLFTIGNAWFSLGPAAVFALSHRVPDMASAGILVAALGAQFAVDFAVSSLRFWIDREAGLQVQLRESWVYGIDAALSVIGLTIASTLGRVPAAALAPLPLLGLLALFAKERNNRIEGLLELSTAYRGTALVLGDFIEADDGYTGEHTRGVVQLAVALGNRLGLSAQQMRNLEFGALLHDVGKIAIPKEIINKPGKLDPNEWAIIKTHTTEGQRILDRIGGFMRNVGLVVRAHHERWDGHGYPDGLAGDAIPLEARIVACCDSWNAMRTDRSYRRALSYEVAIAEMTGNAGTQFDPRVVATLLEIVACEGGSSTASTPAQLDPDPDPAAGEPAGPLLSPP